MNIEQTIASNNIVLFMKGTPDFPQCGFSAQAVKMLNKHKAKFLAINVLEDPKLRAGIKTFSNWPTIPQLYVKKEFIGGCDIICDMDENNELADLLA